MTILKRGMTKDDVALRLYPQDENESPYESQLTCTNNSESAKQYAEAVHATRVKAPIWGWCVAVVEVSWGPFVAKQYLGNCSYKSADDFRENSGYYDDMVEEALKELNSEIEQVVNDLHAHNFIEGMVYKLDKNDNRVPIGWAITD